MIYYIFIKIKMETLPYIISTLENYDDFNTYTANDQNHFINNINHTLGLNITYPPPDDN
jgi:hypothetical protein